jgi:hypothetical protein
MTDTKHSPGPFNIRMGDCVILADADGNAIMGNETYYPWVPKNSYDWDLFAASPELLEALENIRWVSSDKDNMEFTARITCFQLDAINAAINKAKGNV